MNIIQQFEAEQIAKLTAARAVPVFDPGDTLKVMVKVILERRTIPCRFAPGGFHSLNDIRFQDINEARCFN